MTPPPDRSLRLPPLSRAGAARPARPAPGRRSSAKATRPPSRRSSAGTAAAGPLRGGDRRLPLRGRDPGRVLEGAAGASPQRQRRSNCGPGSTGSSATRPSTTSATGHRPPRSSRRRSRPAAAPPPRPRRARRCGELISGCGRCRSAQRAAIVMRELEGLSHEEIAAALGLSGGAARQAIFRARAALRGGLGCWCRCRCCGCSPSTGPRRRGGRRRRVPRGAAARGGGAAWGLGGGARSKSGWRRSLVAGSVGAGVATTTAGATRPRSARGCSARRCAALRSLRDGAEAWPRSPPAAPTRGTPAATGSGSTGRESGQGNDLLGWSSAAVSRAPGERPAIPESAPGIRPRTSAARRPRPKRRLGVGSEGPLGPAAQAAATSVAATRGRSRLRWRRRLRSVSPSDYGSASSGSGDGGSSGAGGRRGRHRTGPHPELT